MTSKAQAHVLAEVAEDPEYFVEPPDGSERIIDERFCVIIGQAQYGSSVPILRRLGFTEVASVHTLQPAA
jgi:hypothetical protein